MMLTLYRLGIIGLSVTLSLPAFASVIVTPEPVSMSLFGVGALGTLAARAILRRRK